MADSASHKLTDEALSVCWITFKTGTASAAAQARDQLILHYQPLVQIVASRVASRLPQHVDKEDLTSYGYIGLIDAIEKFDLDRNLRFEMYAPMRISGQIIDELRKLDWIPRSVHAQIKGLQNAATDLEERLQRPATSTEIAEESGLSMKAFAEARAEQTFVRVMALDAMLDNNVGDETLSLASQLSDRTQDIEKDIEVGAIKDLLAEAMSLLAERESVVLALYYVEGLTLSDIGRLLGVTESRVCQMHTRAMVEVRAKLAA